MSDFRGLSFCRSILRGWLARDGGHFWCARTADPSTRETSENELLHLGESVKQVLLLQIRLRPLGLEGVMRLKTSTVGTNTAWLRRCSLVSLVEEGERFRRSPPCPNGGARCDFYGKLRFRRSRFCSTKRSRLEARFHDDVDRPDASFGRRCWHTSRGELRKEQRRQHGDKTKNGPDGVHLGQRVSASGRRLNGERPSPNRAGFPAVRPLRR